MSDTFARILLAFTALVFAAFGAAFAVAPAAMAAYVEIDAASPTARADLAAIYGGLEIGLAAFLALCLRRGRVQTGLTAAGVALAGIALVRLAHLVAAGGAPVLWGALAAEAAGATLALWGARTADDR